MKKNKEAEQMVKAKFIVLSPVMNELSRRRWAAAEARSLGYGGVSIVSRATGLSRTTITEGLVELSSKWQLTPTKVRHSGGGRKKISDEDRTVLAALEKLVNPMTRGDPMSPLQWTCKSTAKLARELNTQGHTISARTVARLLHDLDYSLQSNRKTKEGTQHPDRNAQFEFINKEAKKFQQRKQPVISVDTKKKELGKGLPYGVYDPARNQGWVSVGIDHDTAYFATATINRWGRVMVKKPIRLFLRAYLANLEADIRALVEPYAQVDPKFRSPFAYTRITARGLRKALLDEKGYTQMKNCLPNGS
jgi:transposase